MVPTMAKIIGRRTSSVGLELQKPSPSPATTDSSQGEAARAAKKVRTIKLKGPKKNASPVGSIEQESSTAARPQRARRPPAAFDQDDRMHIDSVPMSKPAKPAKAAQPAPPSAPSSGSSALSSAPPSPASNSDGSREESPFQDPVDTYDAYGDFALYYTTGLDTTEQAEIPSKKRKRESSGSKLKVDGQAKTEGAKKASKTVASQRSNSTAKATTTPSAPADKSGQMPTENLPPHHARAPLPDRQHQPPHVTKAPPVQRQRQLHHHHHGPSPYPGHPPPGPHMQPASAPALPPAPVIRFIEVPHDPAPTVLDTIAIMIDKLQSLSATLTQFGGVPAVAVTPGPESKMLSNPRCQPAVKPAARHDQLDMILDMFDGGDDESEKSEASPTPVESVVPEVKDFNHVLPNPGTADMPLCFGIQFIQNALKSWAQQRMTHQIMAQWNDEQSRGFFLPQNGKGRGRPKKFEAPPGGPPPVIEMNLTDTPEGVAIRKFQLILDSGCLQVNTVLPIELARALRLLYMQIDNLINQGRTENKGSWYCMSYGAQIAAHHARVRQFKEADARRQQELALLQQQHQQQVMAQMGLNPNTTPMTQEEAQRHHAMELERRRSAQHAQQQPYISQQHLNPLQLASQPSPPSNHHGFSPPLNGMPGPLDTPDGSVSLDVNGVPHKNHFEKIKMYMPGFLPRSGQSMKFSFAPHSEEAVRAFGSEAFPVEGPAGPQLPNRGPMMDVRRTHSSTPSYQAAVDDTPMPDAVRSRSVSNTKEDAIDLTASDGPQPEFTSTATARPRSSNGNVSGFRPINEPARSTPKSPPSRRSSTSAQPAQPCVEVAVRRPSGAPLVKRHNRGSAGSFPHPGAVVVDE